MRGKAHPLPVNGGALRQHGIWPTARNPRTSLVVLLPSTRPLVWAKPIAPVTGPQGVRSHSH